MITLENVSKYFPTPQGRHYILKDVNMEIPAGKKVGVFGLNGAGKSSLLRLFAGVDIPNTGTITRRGNISWPLGLASCLQKAMTGEENTKFACRIQGVTGQAMKDVVASVKLFTELDNYFGMPVSSYSSGMRARLQFAIAMAFDFDCYLIDELTAVGDQAFRNKSDQVFKGKRKNASFIKVSHNLGELTRDCDAALLLHEAKLTYFSDVKDAARVYQSLIGSHERRQLRRERRKMLRMGVDQETVDMLVPLPKAMTPEERQARRARNQKKAAARRRREQIEAVHDNISADAHPPRARKPDGDQDRQAQRQAARRARAEKGGAHTPAPMAPRMRRPVA